MVIMSSPSVVVGFLDQNYCCKLVATHIPHVAGGHQCHTLAKKFFPTWDQMSAISHSTSATFRKFLTVMFYRL